MVEIVYKRTSYLAWGYIPETQTYTSRALLPVQHGLEVTTHHLKLSGHSTTKDRLALGAQIVQVKFASLQAGFIYMKVKRMLS